jgi:hypothetical protein
MRSEGVDVYPSTVALIRRLRALGLKTAVVSASRNCQEILQTARLDRLFDARVDGRVLVPQRSSIPLWRMAVLAQSPRSLFVRAIRRFSRGGCRPAGC